MRDRDLYAQILGITSPWHVGDVRLDVPAGKVELIVEHRGTTCCPQCGKSCPGYDLRLLRWRHLDTCQLQTMLVAEVPSVECPEHGVVQASTPWVDAGSRLTAPFERVVIDWLREASFSAVARRLGLAREQVDGIMARVVDRGLARRGETSARRIGLDETFFRKRHDYVTLVTDLEGRWMLSVRQGRTRESLDAHFSAQPAHWREAVEVVAVDM